jgi:endonuclease/exonuclease/phosphatase family metal-dependent hydrolase
MPRRSVSGDLVGGTTHVTNTLRIMTWNVHGIFHLNPKFDVEGVCSIIRHWSPDIAALQEVDSRGRTDDPFALLAKAIAGHSVDARTIVTEDGDYGQVLLSRWPFAAPPRISDVSYQEREPRRAIAARILADQGEVTVIATHLGLSIHERHAQAHALAELVQPTRTLVLGDFNDWFWVKSVRGVLARICPVRTRLRTFPSHLPMMRLDRIYASRDLTIRSAWTDRKARAYSDHLPVIADVAFGN